MEFVSKPGDAIKLEDDRVYLVVKTLEYEGEAYLYLYEPSEDPVDFLDEDVKKTTFLKEVNENGEFMLEEIMDKKVYNKLVDLVKGDSIFEN